MSPRRLTRAEKRDLRRQERLVDAETPHAQLLAAFDYLRGALSDVAKRDLHAADRIRVEVANYLAEKASGAEKSSRAGR